MSIRSTLTTPSGRAELRRVLLDRPIAKRAADLAPPTISVPTNSRTSWDAVRTTDLTGLARRVVNEDLGPGVPIMPVHPEKTEPRMFDYTPGYNIALVPRTFEEIQFPALQNLSRSWDVAALCIQRNIDDLRQLRWEIRPKAVPGMDRDSVRARRARLERTRAAVEGFWMTPDQEQGWGSWLHEFYTSMYETDSACIYLQVRRDGSLYAVQNVDGTTIAPLIDERGRQPPPPEPAFRQIIRGLPWTYYMADLELDPSERTLNFDRMHMIYEPFWGSTDSPYGHPPIEWILLTVQRALARQVLDYRLFNDGTTPYSFWKMPEAWTDGQIASLQESFDKLQQLPSQRAHLRFMPGGTGSGLENGFMEPKTEGEEFLLHVGCAAYNRSPMEMGFIRSAGGAGLGGKSVAQEQGKSGAKGIRAAAMHLKALIDRITGIHFSAELEIVFPELEDTESALERAQAEDIRIKNGSLGLDEARLDRDLDPIGPNETGGSNFIYASTGPIPVKGLFSGDETSEPTGGGNPPIPSAVPGKATDAEGDVGSLADEILGKSDDTIAKKGPKYVFGRLNPVYTEHAKEPDISRQLDAIRARAVAAGKHPSEAAVRRTFARNLRRELVRRIRARAAQAGKKPSAAEIEGTLRNDLARMPHVASLMSEFSRKSPRTATRRTRRKAMTKALGGKRLEFKGDLATVVHRYLLRSYPPADVAWALDPAIRWEYEPSVKLSDVNLARRPGGRNEDKVESISDSVETGASMDPVVLADFGEPKLRIADGFHRTLGAEKAGKDAVPAFIARDIPDSYRETLMGPMQDDSSSVRKAESAAQDLDRWLRKSLGAVKRGKSAAVPFESDVIPPTTREALTVALAHAESPAAVRAMFEVLP